MTAPLPKARQQVWVSRVLGDYHYKRRSCVTVRYKTLTAQRPCAPSIGQNLQRFTGNGDVSIWVKDSGVERKTENKQTNNVWNDGLKNNALRYILWFLGLLIHVKAVNTPEFQNMFLYLIQTINLWHLNIDLRKYLH